jgi:predicted dehydrogenase
LLDLHIHDLDFIQHCFGRPSGIIASGYSKVSGAIDHVVALLQYPGGPVVSAEGSWGMAEGFPFTMAFTVNFEHATVDFDLSRGDQRLRVSRGGTSETVTLEGPDGYVGEIHHLVEAIQSKRPPTVVTPHDAAAVLELCEAEERSIREGQVVNLD